MDIPDFSEYENNLLPGDLLPVLYPNLHLVKIESNTFDIKISEGIFTKPIEKKEYNSTSTYIMGGIEVYDIHMQLCIKLKNINTNINNLYIYDAFIPNDAEVHIKNDRLLTNKVELTNKRLLKDLDMWTEMEYCKFALSVDSSLNKFIKSTSYELDLLRVKKEWFTIKSIENQTEELCNIALEQSVYALQYIKNPTIRICINAILKDKVAFNYISVDNRVYEVYYALMCWEPRRVKEVPKIFWTQDLLNKVVIEDPSAIELLDRQYINSTIKTTAILSPKFNNSNLNNVMKYVSLDECTDEMISAIVKCRPSMIFTMDNKYVTRDMYILALSCNGLLLHNLHSQDEELCLVAVKNNGLALEYVINKTPEICDTAFKNNPKAIKFMPEESNNDVKQNYNPSEEAIIEIIKKRPEYILDVTNPTPPMLLTAVRNKPSLINNLDKQLLNSEIYMEAVKNDPFALKFIDKDDQTIEMCEIATELKPECIEHMKIYDEDIQLRVITEYPHYIHKIKTCYSKKVCCEAIRQRPHIIHSIPDVFKTPDVILMALKKEPSVSHAIVYKHDKIDIPESQINEFLDCSGLFLKYIPNQTPEICERAVKRTGRALQYVNKELLTDELCLIAINQDPFIVSMDIFNDKYDLCLLAISKNQGAFHSIKNKDDMLCIYACIINPAVMFMINDPIIKKECQNVIDTLLEL